MADFYFDRDYEWVEEFGWDTVAGKDVEVARATSSHWESGEHEASHRAVLASECYLRHQAFGGTEDFYKTSRKRGLWKGKTRTRRMTWAHETYEVEGLSEWTALCNRIAFH